jgi:hypothetical protein
MDGPKWWTIVAAALACNGAACNVGSDGSDDLGKACTAIGCGQNAMLVTLVSSSGIWAEGGYRLSVTLDGQQQTCDFSVPAHLPSGIGVTSLDCGGSDFEAGLGEYGVSLQFSTKPKTLGLELARDGTVLLNDRREPTYEESRPNGPYCEPVCKWADFQVIVQQ